MWCGSVNINCIIIGTKTAFSYFLRKMDGDCTSGEVASL